MASLFKDQNKLSAYRDRRFPGTQEEFKQALLSSTTVYVGNLSFYTTEEQVYELFNRAGEIKKITVGLDKNAKTPCGGGYGKLVQKELEAQTQLLDYGSGSLDSFPPVVLPSAHGRQGGNQGYGGGSYRHNRDYHHKRYREDDRQTHEASRRSADYDSHRNSDPDSRPEKNPRFRGSGDSDNEEGDDRKRHP